MKIKQTIILLNILFLSLACIIIVSCRGESVKNGMLIITEAPVNINNQNFISGESWRYLPGARICAFLPGKPSSLKVLTEKFYSACSPKISYDGRHMLFSGQQNKDESWQIWEMELDNLKCRKIISFKENCTDPDYLPGGRLVFSKLTINDTVKTAHCLYTCSLDGSDISQITFGPEANFATTVLKDGRLLTVSRQVLPENGDPVLTVLRPDGTKADMFYKPAEGVMLISRPSETADGKILFIESGNKDRSSGRLVSISYNRPLHTRIDMTSGINGDFHSVLPFNNDNYLVSYRKSEAEHLELFSFDPKKNILGPVLLSDPEYDVLDALVAREYERPRKLPSEVDLNVKTGLLLCQNINYSDMPVQNNLSDVLKAVKIEVLGVDTTYGVVQVEEDGSFYLKIMADTPFRIRTLDKNGKVINSPCSYLWLRPNERRGCVGCHENPETAPENRVSFAVRKAPVIIPVHITEIKEKMVELE